MIGINTINLSKITKMTMIIVILIVSTIIFSAFAKCPDGKCDSDENYYSCPKDCRLNQKVTIKPICGDKVCDYNENSRTCSKDCKSKLDIALEKKKLLINAIASLGILISLSIIGYVVFAKMFAKKISSKSSLYSLEQNTGVLNSDSQAVSFSQDLNKTETEAQYLNKITKTKAYKEFFGK